MSYAKAMRVFFVRRVMQFYVSMFRKKQNNMKQSNAETFNDVLRTCQSDAVDDICFIYMYIYMSIYIYIHIHMRGT